MAAGCCNHDAKFDGLSPGFRRALWIVIAINAVMFVVEITAGALAGSQALLADALDFLGDTLTYGISLMVLGMPLRVRATAALAKGISLAAMGLFVFASTAWQLLVLGLPSAGIMGVVGLLALLANLASVLVLMRYKDGDANVRSVWLCSRNDAIGNIAVVAAAAGVFLTGTAWPDLIVAALMATLFLWSATQIIRQAWGELRHTSSLTASARPHPLGSLSQPAGADPAAADTGVRSWQFGSVPAIESGAGGFAKAAAHSEFCPIGQTHAGVAIAERRQLAHAINRNDQSAMDAHKVVWVELVVAG